MRKMKKQEEDVSSYGSLLKDIIRKHLNKLTDRERQVVDFRFGLSDGYSRTIEEVARLFNTTRESIRTIEAKCLSEVCKDSRMRELCDGLA